MISICGHTYNNKSRTLRNAEAENQLDCYSRLSSVHNQNTTITLVHRAHLTVNRPQQTQFRAVDTARIICLTSIRDR